MTRQWKTLHKDIRNILIILQYNLGDHVKENEKAGHSVRVCEISWKWHHVNEQACSVGKSSDVYSKYARFESAMASIILNDVFRNSPWPIQESAKTALSI